MSQRNALLADTVLRSEPADRCPVCAEGGQYLYTELEDRLFGVSGRWKIRECTNRSCGLLWLDPTPLTADLGLAYQNYYTHGRIKAPRRSRSLKLLRSVWLWIKFGYLSRRFGYRIPGVRIKRLMGLVLAPFPTRRECLDVAAMYLSPSPGGRLLDVGSGDGSSLELLRDLGWEVQGVDVDPDAVEQARSRGLSVRLGGIQDQHFASGSFDAITMAHVIEHLPDPLEAMIECRRILRPKGQLVIVTPNAASMGHAHFKSSWRGLEPPRHLQVFTPSALNETVRQAGLRISNLFSTARMASMIYRESRSLQGVRESNAVSAFVFQARERIRLVQQSWVGEELVLIAERT